MSRTSSSSTSRRPPAHRVALERAGARVLHDYRTLDAFAVTSPPRAAKRVARLPGVARLAPVEVIRAEAEQEVDQSKGTTADVGAPALWNQGVTGTGIRIAVLDTGADVMHPDLDDLDFRRWSSLLNPRKVVDARSFLERPLRPACRCGRRERPRDARRRHRRRDRRGHAARGRQRPLRRDRARRRARRRQGHDGRRRRASTATCSRRSSGRRRRPARRRARSAPTS